MPATLDTKEEEKRRRMRQAEYASEYHKLKSIPPKKLTAGMQLRLEHLEILRKKK